MPITRPEDAPTRKLTWRQVRLVRALYAEEIATYGKIRHGFYTRVVKESGLPVTSKTISEACRNKAWKE